MLRIRLMFISEGTSDQGLLSHLEDLCIRAGADEVSSVAPDLATLPSPPGHSIQQKIQAALKLEPSTNLVFIHRDSDSRNPKPRRAEIDAAAQAASLEHVPVLPIQALEAWLLLDESMIRLVASNPGGSEALRLPKASKVEDLAQPKEVLSEALVTASALKGRRLKRFRKQFPRHRARLLQLLDIDGPISRLPAWQRLVADTQSAVGRLLEQTASNA